MLRKVLTVIFILLGLGVAACAPSPTPSTVSTPSTLFATSVPSATLPVTPAQPANTPEVAQAGTPTISGTSAAPTTETTGTSAAPTTAGTTAATGPATSATRAATAMPTTAATDTPEATEATEEPPKPSNPGGPGPAVNLTGNAQNGSAVFAANCVACHGPQGKGGINNPGSADGTVPPLNPIDPGIASKDPKTFATNVDLFIEHGSKPEGTNPTLVMPAWGDTNILTPQQIADVIAYIMSLNPQ